jgi:hypothetical protein
MTSAAIATLVTLAGSIAGTHCTFSGVGGGLCDWLPLCGAALVVSSVILAFLYMWSELFHNQALQAYVHQELYEVLVSGLLAILIIALVSAMGGLTLGDFLPSYLLPQVPAGQIDGNTNIYTATALYYEQVTSDMESWLNLNYLMNILVDQMASVTPYARPMGVGLVASPMAGFASPIKQLLYNMTVGLSVAYVINVAQLYAYVFALQGFMVYYLPLGIFLRCFTPTRRLGGTLIAIGATFLFVFPALTIVTYSMFYNPTSGPLLTFSSLLGQYMTPNGDFGDFVSNFFTSGFTTTGGTGTGLGDMVTSVFGSIGTVLQGVVGNVFLMLLLFPVSLISLAFVLGFVMPALNVIILTETVKGLSKSLGEEVDISSLTRLI